MPPGNGANILSCAGGQVLMLHHLLLIRRATLVLFRDDLEGITPASRSYHKHTLYTHTYTHTLLQSKTIGSARQES